MRFLIALLCAAFSIPSARAQQKLSAALRDGDIVLQSLPCGGLCDAIVETTPCVPGRPFNHCGIARHTKEGVLIIEAIGTEVKETPLDSFLKREQSATLFVARPKAQYTSPAAAVAKARTFLGRPYDDAFLPGDSALYCSELVFEAFDEKSSAGLPLFTLVPMTFISPRTKALYPAWDAYYEQLGESIPEGLPGINPCAIANSGFVTLLELPRK